MHRSVPEFLRQADLVFDRYNQVYGSFLSCLLMTSVTHSAVEIPTAPKTGLQLSALLHRAGISRLDGTGWIQVTGSDRARWLNGMATNGVQQLEEGTGAYNFFLNAQGRIQGDGYIFSRPDRLLIETQSSQIATLIPYLDHYVIMDDVELKDITGTWAGLTVTGPQSASLLSQIGLSVTGLKPLDLRDLPWKAATISVIYAFSPLVPRYELWGDAATIDGLWQALQSAGAALANPESLEWLRILEGTPRYGIDIRDRELPQETGQTRALHFSKGCYLGQEIVERIRSRGNVHRIFQAFRIEGELPATGVALESAGKPSGELITIAVIPVDGKPLQLALGYVRREALDRGGPLTYPGGTAVPVATPLRTDEASTPPQTSESSERK
jgi:folate-binding protein YgfZ